MRQLEFLAREREVVEEQEVQVERSGGPALALRGAAESVLEVVKAGEEGMGVGVGGEVKLDDGVHVPGLGRWRAALR